MSLYGLSSYDKCIRLMNALKEKNFTEIKDDELAKYIVIYIGGSKYYQTVRRYLEFMQGMELIKPKDAHTFILQYDKVIIA